MRRPRIALLTPYTGTNLGDAAIQDAIMANLRRRLPGAEFSGISLNCDSFAERHGVDGFPLCGTSRQFYGMLHGSVPKVPNPTPTHEVEPSGKEQSPVRRVLKQIPWLWRGLRKVYSYVLFLPHEIHHSIQGYHFLRAHNLLIVSGGGQLDEEWGGPWGHPFALFKWAVLAKMAGVPFAMASVGACKVTSSISRLFLSAALGMARYRTYRDENSKKIAARLVERAVRDSVVPDLAFSIPSSELPPFRPAHSPERLRPVIAISPIAYAKPEYWPCQDRSLYDRYVRHMAQVVSLLIDKGYFVLLVYSSVGDDDHVIPEIINHLGEDAKREGTDRIQVSSIATWKDFVVSLRDADLLVASRLHSAILGFVTHKPTVAISFDPKVDWVMEDLGQTDYLFQIDDFTAGDVITALERIDLRRDAAVRKIIAYLQSIHSVSEQQYDRLASLAIGEQVCCA